MSSQGHRAGRGWRRRRQRQQGSSGSASECVGRCSTASAKWSTWRAAADYCVQLQQRSRASVGPSFVSTLAASGHRQSDALGGTERRLSLACVVRGKEGRGYSRRHQKKAVDQDRACFYRVGALHVLASVRAASSPQSLHTNDIACLCLYILVLVLVSPTKTLDYSTWLWLWLCLSPALHSASQLSYRSCLA
jgi:hypothetical protein